MPFEEFNKKEYQVKRKTDETNYIQFGNAQPIGRMTISRKLALAMGGTDKPVDLFYDAAENLMALGTPGKGNSGAVIRVSGNSFYMTVAKFVAHYKLADAVAGEKFVPNADTIEKDGQTLYVFQVDPPVAELTEEVEESG